MEHSTPEAQQQAQQQRPSNQRPVALVTGGARGLGLLVAEELAASGHDLALMARSAQELDQAAARIRQGHQAVRVEVFACDVADREGVERTVRQVEDDLGPIEVLMNVAGIIQVGPAQDVVVEQFDQAIDTMLLGPVNVTWAVLPAMRSRGRGRIGTVCSIGGAISVPHLLAYSTAKFGAVGFSEGLSAELAGTGITATTIMPGLMRTGSHQRAQFLGNKDHEYAWFAPSASLPGISMAARTAARRMVRGTLRGRTHVILTPLAKVAIRVHGLMPSTVVRLLGVAARLLPGPVDQAGARRPSEGRRLGGLRTSGLVRALTWLGDRAARRNQEHPEAG